MCITYDYTGADPQIYLWRTALPIIADWSRHFMLSECCWIVPGTLTYDNMDEFQGRIGD